MKKLPKKWFISTNQFEEDFAILEEYRNSIPEINKDPSLNNYKYLSNIDRDDDNSYITDDNLHEVSGFKELTFDEFERLVLNKSNEPQYEIY